MSPDSRPLIIACGALVSELRAVLVASGIDESVEVKYLPANLHNRPENISPQVEELLAQNQDRRVFVAYADCGTGGHLDLVLRSIQAFKDCLVLTVMSFSQEALSSWLLTMKNQALFT